MRCGHSACPPVQGALDIDGDDGTRFERHCEVLRVAGAQEGEGARVLVARFDDARPAAELDVAELRPVGVVVHIDQHLDVRLVRDIAEAADPRDVAALGLLVDGRVQGVAFEREADGDEVRAAVRVGGREARDAPGVDEGAEGVVHTSSPARPAPRHAA